MTLRSFFDPWPANFRNSERSKGRDRKFVEARDTTMKKHEGRHKRQEGSGLAKVCKHKRAGRQALPCHPKEGRTCKHADAMKGEAKRRRRKGELFACTKVKQGERQEARKRVRFRGKEERDCRDCVRRGDSEGGRSGVQA